MVVGVRKESAPAKKAGAVRFWQDLAGRLGARLDQAQRLLDVLDAGKRDSQRLGDLGAGLASLDELLDVRSSVLGDDCALSPLCLTRGLRRPALPPLRSGGCLQRLHE